MDYPDKPGNDVPSAVVASVSEAIQNIAHFNWIASSATWPPRNDTAS